MACANAKHHHLVCPGLGQRLWRTWHPTWDLLFDQACQCGVYVSKVALPQSILLSWQQVDQALFFPFGSLQSCLLRFAICQTYETHPLKDNGYDTTILAIYVWPPKYKVYLVWHSFSRHCNIMHLDLKPDQIFSDILGPGIIIGERHISRPA
jgi:hypothetical protein